LTLLKPEIAGTYPEIMETEKFDKHFKNAEQVNFNDFDKASEFLRKNRDWQIYTEVEAEDKYYMDRGFHICNRTWNYSIVKDPRYKVMTYTGFDEK